MNSNIIFKNLKTIALFIALSCMTNAYSQSAFTPQKGASGRELTTVKMFTDETRAATEDVKMQSTHELRQIIYLKKTGDTKKLLLQTTNNGGYYRWFRYDTHAALNKSYFSFSGAAEKTNFGKDGLKYTDVKLAATVTSDMLSNDTSHPTIIACDFSKYSDFKGSSEPTIMYRMIYVLQPATEISAKLDNCTASTTDTTYLEKYNMIAPNGGKTIILGTKYPYMGGSGSNFQSNYYVNSGATQVTNGTWYEQAATGGTLTALTGTVANNKQYTFTGSSSAGTKVYVLKSTVSGKDYYIAKFTVNYQDETKVGPSATTIHDDSYLSTNYKEIAARRFDFTDANGNLPKDGAQNWAEPMDFDENTYGFIYKPSNYTTNTGANSTVDLSGFTAATGISWAHYAFLSSSAHIGNWAYTNLDDRLYISSGNKKRGYFYYVDAAETQGTVAKMDISQACCQGTDLYFSAWVANANKEGTGKFKPNLNFQITAQDENGNESTITTFTTGNFGDTSGATNNTNSWMQVFFGFQIPRNTNYKKLYLNVINNQVSSAGDDFIIDDIVAYMEKPAIEAEQTALLCGPQAEVKVHIDYNQMLKVCAMNNLTNETSLNIGYCFLDAEKYNALLAEGKTTDEAKAQSLIELNNPTVSGSNYVGQFILYAQNGKTSSTWYKEATAGETSNQIIQDLQTSPYVYRETHNGKDALYFIVKINGHNLEPGKTYYTVFDIKGNTNLTDLSYYSIDKSCDAYTSFVLKGTGKILVDGTTDLYEQGGDMCYNLTPTFQVNQLSYTVSGTTKWVDTKTVKLKFDWFKGTIEDYYNQKYTEADGTAFSAHDALISYRAIYETSNNPKEVATGVYTAAKRKVIMDLTSDSNGDDNTLILCKSSLTPKISTLGKHYFVAIPVTGTYYDPSNEYIGICLDEQIIVYNAVNKAPKLEYGLPGITYGDKEIIPLRIGLLHAKAIANGAKVITIPIRSVETVTNGSTVLKEDVRTTTLSTSMYLIATTDANMSEAVQDFKAVGTVKVINADNSKTNTATDMPNYLQIYLSSAFASAMKEGYTYNLKFYYAELKNGTTDYTNACDGNTVVILKVVPEYETWTGGAGNQDWNNDANWQRSDNGEIYKDNTYTSNTVNTTSNGFVPLDFTNVTIAKGTTANAVPVMAKHTVNSTSGTLDLDATATTDIAYDMVITTTSDANVYGCKEYYENTCKDLYLKPEAEIMNAQLLTYNKAHVDFELTPKRWYLLSSPLQGVIAGDMYTLTSNARQETDAFADITFDAAKNNRFNPAVYQRSWDNSTSVTYDYLPQESTRSVYAKANWSNVYNDVDVSYKMGNGFSVKAVANVSGNTLFRLPKADASYTYYNKDGTTGETNTSLSHTNAGKLFSDYFASADAVTSTVSNSSTDNNLFLVGNPFPCQMDMDKFFANTTNAALLDSKYWMMTADNTTGQIRQDAVIFSEGGTISTGTTSGTTLTPMQGFFVKLKDGVTNTGSIGLEFTKDMMTGESNGIASPGLRARPIRTSTHKLYLTAKNQTAESGIVLMQNESADNAFNSSEDVEVIDNSLLRDKPLMYSVAGNTAVQINQFKNLSMIPVGVMNGSNDTTAVSITGVAGFGSDLALYDSQIRTTTTLNNDTVIVFQNNASGRYFLTLSSAPTSIDNHATDANAIEFFTPADGQLEVVSALSSPLTDVAVYGIGGELTDRRSGINSNSETFMLHKGVYIVKAKNGKVQRIGKIVIR
jgi:hypothetical protein